MNMKSLLGLFVSIIMIINIQVSAYANDFSNTDLNLDYAPIVYVQDESELPQSMRRNIKIIEDKLYKMEEKERAFEQWKAKDKAENAPNRSMNVTPYAIITPNVNMVQNPQERDYYCGYSCLQSILDFNGVFMTQEEIAAQAYGVDRSLAWFTGANDATNLARYPAAVFLNTKIEHFYQPLNSYFGSFNVSVLEEKVRYDIDACRTGVLVCGQSTGDDSDGSRLPNYPTNRNIGHWILIDGYNWDNIEQCVTSISFIDPAKSDCVTWSGSISEYSSTDSTRLFRFASHRGIIW